MIPSFGTIIGQSVVTTDTTMISYCDGGQREAKSDTRGYSGKMRHTAWHPRSAGAKGRPFDDAGICPGAIGYLAGHRKDACNTSGTQIIVWMGRKVAHGADMSFAARCKRTAQTAPATESTVHPGIRLGRRAGFAGYSGLRGLTKPKKKAMLSQNSGSRMCVDRPGVPGMFRSCVSASRANILSKVGYYV